MNLVFAATLAVAVGAGKDAPNPYELVTDRRQVRSEAVELLVQQLADPRKGRSAARRLIPFGGTAVPALRKALSDEGPQVRFYAASVLALIPDPAATKILLRVLADEIEPPVIRRIAARAMSRAYCREAIPVLVRLAERAYPPAEAGTDAEGHSDRDNEPLSDPSGEPFRYEVVKALAYMGPAAADEIVMAALADPSPRIREVAAQGLGDHRVPGAVPALTKTLTDPEGGVVTEAARALGKFGRLAAPATESLLGLLDHDDARVRRAARGALILATRFSFSTAEKWRAWWERRQERLEAERAAELREPEKEDEGEPGAARWPSGEKSRGTPPALRMPWEREDEDRSETPQP